MFVIKALENYSCYKIDSTNVKFLILSYTNHIKEVTAQRDLKKLNQDA
jgi:hypothetical protein